MQKGPDWGVFSKQDARGWTRCCCVALNSISRRADRGATLTKEPGGGDVDEDWRGGRKASFIVSRLRIEPVSGGATGGLITPRCFQSIVSLIAHMLHITHQHLDQGGAAGDVCVRLTMRWLKCANCVRHTGKFSSAVEANVCLKKND